MFVDTYVLEVISNLMNKTLNDPFLTFFFHHMIERFFI